MSEWQPAKYRDYRWIVADPELLGGRLALRGTRLSVSLILECLANGMTFEDINEAYASRRSVGNFFRSHRSWLGLFVWLLDAKIDVHLR